MEGRVRADRGDIGLDRLDRVEPAVQRDRCARCHLQGEARFELTKNLDTSRPIAGQFPVLVTDAEPHRDFRFVGQLERLALSACFKGSPAMTCSTCHDPHASVSSQGVESFDRACVSCHQQIAEQFAEQFETNPETHTGGTSAQSVTGDSQRTTLGCVDCHVRRSQPFDLPHVRTADHYVRTRIEAPEHDIPHRQFTNRDAGLRLYHEETIRAQLATPAGKRWRAGIEAMGLVTMGQVDAAAARFDEYPAPGTPEAVTPAAPELLAPLETSPEFHHLRGLTLMAKGRLPDALAAFSDALEIDPHFAQPRLARAQLRNDMGDLVGALHDTEEVVQLYPTADAPWRLRANMTARAGRPDFATMALERATELWPSDAALWQQLGELATAAGKPDLATDATQRARQLGSTPRPSGASPTAPSR